MVILVIRLSKWIFIMKIHYGNETKKALNNFPFSIHPVKIEFIGAIVNIKKAAAEANYQAHNFNLNIKDSIIKACDEILKGEHNKQFILSSFQGGAGTSINTNINEIIASIASSKLLNKEIVHPNNHVNCSQSTNDVNPSALKITTNFLLKELDKELSSLIKSFENKAKNFSNIYKLGRTHLQDAIPTTLGAEFQSYAENLNKHQIRIKEVLELTRVLNLGGTAIGNSINASPIYIKKVYKELNGITKGNFVKAKNLISATNSQTDFLIISQMIVALTVDLSKIASDFRFMSSGPNGGIGEIILPELQKGSSIMPGKINPIIPETVNQLYYLVSGNNLIIEKATEAAQLELGVMLPIIIDKLVESIKLTTEVMIQFNELCVKGIKADQKKCLYHLENSTAYATLLVKKFGYDIVSDLVKEAVLSGKTLRDIITSRKYLTNKEFDNIVSSFRKKL